MFKKAIMSAKKGLKSRSRDKEFPLMGQEMLCDYFQ